MVFQREKPVVVYGQSAVGAQVNVVLNQVQKSATADSNGKWKIIYDPLAVGGPYQMTVSTVDTSITYPNILSGDVWLCGGQSNMAMQLVGDQFMRDEMSVAKIPNLRLIRMPLQASGDLNNTQTGNTYWLESDSVSAKLFSAIGYYFGKRMHQETNVPVGMIAVAWGGSTVESWISRQALAPFDDFKPFLEELDTSIISVEELNRRAAVELQRRNDAIAAGKSPETDPYTPFALQHFPTVSFNGNINPIKDFQVKGVIWYQGEGNVSRAWQYRSLFPVLINDWRAKLNNPELPFYFVQLPNYGLVRDYPSVSQWAELRESQEKALTLPNTGMVVTIDIGACDNLHPTNKRDVGYRLSNIALKNLYGRTEINSEFPRLKSYTVQGSSIICEFDNVGTGLKVMGGAVTEFSIAGENGYDLEYKFKKPDDPLRLVFVCSMWLTGFDAPTVSTLYIDKPMKDHTLMQTITRANRVTDYTINNKPKKNGLIVDYYNVFRNLKKAFASYGGGTFGGSSSGEDVPVQEKDQLYVLLADAINECREWCSTIGVNLTEIKESKVLFNKLGLFDDFADVIVANDEQRKQFVVYDNTIDALYEACRPEILGRRKDFPLAAIIHYLREVIDGRADRADLESAKRRISQLLDESIVAQAVEEQNSNKPLVENIAAEGNAFTIKTWKQIDLSKLDIEKLKEEYKEAPHKNIEIADLRAFISDKLQQMMERNVTRISFAQKLQEIIDRYNSGNATNENFFDDLMAFVDKMREEEMRAAKEGLTDAELEIFDLLKKENLTKDEEQKVKLAAKSLLHKLQDERPTVLITDWFKDTQTRMQVQIAIKKVLDETLPKSYDREIYSNKCDRVYDHFLTMAQSGGGRAYA